jgi:hypothetical protein
VLTPMQDSDWGRVPVFIIPKKDGTVHFITDNHKVNKLIKMSYPLPHLASTIQELLGDFQFASALDLNTMGYYTSRLMP